MLWGALVFFFASSADLYSPSEEKDFASVEIQLSQSHGGAILALRQPLSHFDPRWPSKLEHRKLLKAESLRARPLGTIVACYNMDCQRLGKNWVFFGTDPGDFGKLRVALIDGNLGMEKTFYLERNPLQLKRAVELRLPAEVQESLEGKEELVERDRRHNRKVLSNISSLSLPEKWEAPVRNSSIVSAYASPRYPPRGSSYYHRGTDFRAPMGTPVLAAGSGVVLDISNQVLGGTTITVDHGQGIMTRYLHLSKVLVTIGQTVGRGDQIALSGNSGRVEAPHLHWEMRVRAKPVDPVSGSKFLEYLSSQESSGSPEQREPASSH